MLLDRSAHHLDQYFRGAFVGPSRGGGSASLRFGHTPSSARKASPNPADALSKCPNAGPSGLLSNLLRKCFVVLAPGGKGCTLPRTRLEAEVMDDRLREVVQNPIPAPAGGSLRVGTTSSRYDLCLETSSVSAPFLGFASWVLRFKSSVPNITQVTAAAWGWRSSSRTRHSSSDRLCFRSHPILHLTAASLLDFPSPPFRPRISKLCQHR